MHPLLWCYMDRNRHVIELSAKNWINFTLSCKNKSYTVTSHNSGLLLGVGSTGHITIDCYLTNLLFPHYYSTSTVSCTSSNSLILRQAILQMMHCTLYCFQQANGICLFYPQSILALANRKKMQSSNGAHSLTETPRPCYDCAVPESIHTPPQKELGRLRYFLGLHILQNNLVLISKKLNFSHSLKQKLISPGFVSYISWFFLQ